MQKKIWLLALAMVGAVLLSGTAAWAESEFYVIAAGPNAVGTKITSVPYTIINPGFYYLTGNLSYSGTTGAITISANDVTLDLMGFSLTGPGDGMNGYAIYMSGRTNVEVRNGTLRGFACGIVEENGTNHRVINVRAINNGKGIYLFGKNHLIKNCSGSNNLDIGLFVESGLITDSAAHNNDAGIGMFGPGSVLGNTACNNGHANFRLGYEVATSIMVDRNSAFGLSRNYYILLGTTGIVGLDTGTKTNAGAP